MKTKLVKKYFMFALKNWWTPFCNFNWDKLDTEIDLVTFNSEYEDEEIFRNEKIEIWQEWNWQEKEFATFIMDKDFISGVARWMIWNIKLYNKIRQEFENDFKGADWMSFEEYITIYQAKAIRDDKVDEFINKILN